MPGGGESFASWPVRWTADRSQARESHPPGARPRSNPRHRPVYSTVTLFARLRGLSTSQPSATAVW